MSPQGLRKNWLIGPRKPVLLAALILVLFITGVLSLFSVPPLESTLWWGDETWRMLQARGLILTGHPVIPEALGSTLSQNIGLIAGANWVALLLYGIPYALANGDSVVVGRIITLVLSPLLLGLTYKLARRIELSREASLAAVILLQANYFYILGSHSARLDLITSIGVTFYLLFLVTRKAPLTKGGLVSTGLIFGGLFLLYVHAMALVVIPLLLFVIIRKLRLQELAFIFFGSAVAMLSIVIPFVLLTGGLQLYGPLNESNQFSGVAGSLPILHLNSLNAQRLNFVGRIELWWNYAPIYLLLILSAAACAVGYWSRITSLQRDYLLLSIGLLASSQLLQGSAVFYVIHILPAISVAILVGLAQLPRSRVISAALAVLLTTLSLIWVFPRMERGSSLISREASAATRLLRSVPNGSTVLGDQGTEHLIAREQRLSLMTHHFLLFPTPRSVHADYALFFNASHELREWFDGEVADFITGDFNEERVMRGGVEEQRDTLFLLRSKIN